MYEAIQQVLTHMVAFLIMLYILKRFAWKPLLGMLDDRRQKIADEFASIEETRHQTDAVLAEYEDRLRKIEDEARSKINEAVAEGQRIASEIKSNAQEDARRITERAKAELDRDVEKARVQLKQDMVNMTLQATERLMRETMDESAHRKMVERFLDEVEARA